jgi:DnaK suppressor protein
VNKRDLKHFQERLIQERVQLLKELGYFEDKIFNNSQRDAAGDLSAYSVHMADQASDAQEREKAYHMASAEGRLLYHIDEALRRIKEGTYGQCQICGKTIKKARLEIVPHARLCIECKKAEENGPPQS